MKEIIKESYAKKYFPTGFKRELKCLLEIFFPCLFTNLFRFLNPLISLIMCGHLSKLQFDAATLANSIVNIFGVSIDLGFSTAYDTLFAQIYGSNKKKKMGSLLQRGVIVITLIYFILACLHLNIEPFLIWLKQDPLVAELTTKYLTIYLPGLFFDFQFVIMSRYLQNQNIVYPMMISAFISNIVNITCQYVVIFIYGYGIEASAGILAFSTFTMFSLQLMYVLISKIYKASWDGFSVIDALENWNIIFILGLPGILMISLKEWNFEITTLIAVTGSIDGVQLGAQSIAFQTASIIFVMTVGLGISITIRIGQYLGSREIDRLKTILRTAILIGICSSTLCFSLIMIFRSHIAALFSNDLEIQNEGSKLLVYIAFFQFLDTTSILGASVLKACGRQLVGAFTMFFGYYIIGTPIGLTLVYTTNLNIQSMWIGLIIAILVEGIIFWILICRTNWEEECDKALVNTKYFEHKIVEEFLLDVPNENSGEVISNETFKKTLILRIITISVVFLMFVTCLLLRIFLPKSLYLPCLVMNNETILLYSKSPEMLCNVSTITTI